MKRASQGAEGSKHYSRLAAQHSRLSLSRTREPHVCDPATTLQRWFSVSFL